MGSFKYRIKVGKGGRVTIPKAIRDNLGIREGDELVIGIEDSKIVIEKMDFDINEFDEIIRRHLETIRSYLRIKPRLGDLSGLSLEDEFEEDLHNNR
ncbi:AbrB/MazE/SpoVT family DNA-binding domain-containing protein [Vulcanisaeta sp. JCM 14467]|uniref:AbrB/MazE/SpoVT family DNA-binding domain-containing protein n=1 Tax=Vulcanisaeta sp. JCM 14467 TaxID=1295370 RepID=UPI00209240D6|nr:AbrB/MazE/SpoVT family DNA-binding domain-containing protein [Vulcanisaeta sp. JCM 14467]